MTHEVLSTPLADVARADSPTWTDFAGFKMPVQFTGIVAEHLAVRKACGLFDISHMGRLTIVGPHAESAVQRLVTRNVGNLPVGAIRYSFICDAEGNILDDLMVARLDSGWQLIVNAANRTRVIRQIRQSGYVSLLHDATFETAMMALQGPQAVQMLEDVWPESVASTQPRYRLWKKDFVEARLTCSRTGYTGEDGCEIYGPPQAVSQLWQLLRTAGAAPCGLGSRDSLRNEAGLPLFGHELRPDSNPWELGLEKAVSLEKEFIGRDRMQRHYEAGVHHRRMGLVLQGRRIARENMPVFRPDHDQPVGRVTSGTWSPLHEKPIAQACLDVECAVAGTELQIDVRGRREPAMVVELADLKPRQQ